ncbi:MULTISPECIES: hypothetical protein [Geobacillus]|uniref:Uncharacterized protein n=1 Tax=Geobacillus proteiniphilus TaxID=860353 RepID=A0A1Q5T939_9BACL|nr:MULTISPECIES: hypothetical protein [Geobacillus]ADU95854.1 hypothetical protein GYMC52_3510 [Geobacillus sp. Y412MC52]OKO96743.1 hypothetical protein BRO54_0296 [Geobacillus proteiniphilus]
MDWIVGIALVIIVFFSTNMIERTLKVIKDQNDVIIELLREIKNKI